MNDFLQATINGIAQGSVYALLALGYVMIYKATQVISFAQPALMVLGGLASYHFIVVFGLPFWIGLLLGMIVGAVIGMIVERTALRPMLGKPVFTLAIITIGVDYILRVIANRYIGVTPRIIPFPGGDKVVSFGNFSLPAHSVALILITFLIVVLMSLFFQFSKTGLAMRATALDQETSMAQGINVGLIFGMAWAIAGALAAVAGTFLASGTASGLEQTSWVIALKALPAIIIGGLDSLKGAVVGGILIGVVEALTATYQPDFAPWLGGNFALVAPYALMFFVLLVKPYGLFGTKEVERV